MLTQNRGRAYRRAFLGCVIGAGFLAPFAGALDVKQVDRSVLRVMMLEMKDGKATGQGSIGTGFVVDREYVVTNHHVIDDSKYRAKGNTVVHGIVDETSSYEKPRVGELIWSSVELDLAVLRIKGLNRPSLTLSTRVPATYPNKGEIVWAIGYPGLADEWLKSEQGLMSSTVTKGVVSKVVEGKSSGMKDKVRPVIQHDASIINGNSGGPLFDDCGLVVGVNTFVAYTIMRIGKLEGQDVAHGQPNSGIFFAPHISNFIESQKTVAALKPMSLTTSATECPSAMGETGGLPIWVYAAISLVALLAIGATVLALRKGTTREVVRMVESYSAYVKRKGKPPSDYSMQPRRVTSPPDISMPGPSAAPALSKAAAGGWKLDGKGSKGQAVRISISTADMDRAMAKKEAGIILGRSSTLADVVIEDETVSRRHAKIYVTETGLAVEDLKSAYGSEVNGHKVEAFQPVEIKPGDRLKLGGVELAFARAK